MHMFRVEVHSKACFNGSSVTTCTMFLIFSVHRYSSWASLLHTWRKPFRRGFKKALLSSDSQRFPVKAKKRGGVLNVVIFVQQRIV